MLCFHFKSIKVSPKLYCIIAIFGDIPKLSGHSPGPLAVDGPA